MRASDRWVENEARADEAIRVEGGRVVEARGTDQAGGRIFAVEIITAGDSRNGRRYTEAVLHAGARLYEGAKAFDHHRTTGEIQTSSIAGLVGHYRNVAPVAGGIAAELYLLPSATHVAEALDASLAAQAAGLPPVVGISHDVLADWRPVTAVGGRRLQEATAITKVLSADVVADPSAGGRATRMVAGGFEDGDITDPTEVNAMPLKQLIALLRSADAARRAELLTEHAAVLTTAGLESTDIGFNADGSAVTTTNPDPAPAAPASDPAPAPVADPAPAPAAADPVAVTAGATEATYGRGSFTGRQLVTGMVAAANLDARLIEGIVQQLPERFTEADVTRHVEIARRVLESTELANMRPGVVAITQDQADKTRERVYATVCGRWQEGFRSWFEMYEAVTGRRLSPWGDGDPARQLIRESWAPAGTVWGGRATEAVDSTSWAQVLGDSITRRLLEMYRVPNLQTWRAIARTYPVRDFRTQRATRMGGFGNLPAVLEGGPYQPLTSQIDEEATYGVTKRGGTESVTFETITNDDIGALARLPQELANAAARTLFEFVWLTNFVLNPTCTYDSVALFNAGHANTTAVALSNAGVSQLRGLMRDQAAYGIAGKPLGLTPAYLVVPNELEDLGNQICNGDRAIPATTPGATDVPNLHKGLTLLVNDYFVDANDWFLACDPSQLATVEVGFLQGNEEPQLLMQDDARQGTPFSSDEVTWKIRHIYGATVTDHRGVQRGTQ